MRGVDGKDTAGPFVDLAQPDARWVRVGALSTQLARTYVLEWIPRRSGASLTELEVWARQPGAHAAAGAGIREMLFRGTPPGARAFLAKEPERRISASTSMNARSFAIDISEDPRSFQRAFLVYHLSEQPHFTAARRAINGGPVVGGFGVSEGAPGGVQVEEISPAALRLGANTIRFSPSPASDPVGYLVSSVRIVGTHLAAERAETGIRELDDGKETTGWQAKSGATRRWTFGRRSQPHELEFRVPKAQHGKLSITGSGEGGRHDVSVILNDLKAGWHRVSLDAMPPADSVTVSLEGAREEGAFISEMSMSASAVPSSDSPVARVTYPLNGECVNHQVHVRGIAQQRPQTLRVNGAPISDAVFEAGGFAFTRSERSLGGNGAQPFKVVLEAVGRGNAVDRIEIPIQGCVDRPPVVAGRNGATMQPREDLGAPYGQTVRPNQDATLAFADASLDIPSGAVAADTRITVRPLAEKQVSAMGPGMVNVTGERQAFRFGPRGMIFNKPVRVTLPVDSGQVSPEDHLGVFYFDEFSRKWEEVKVVGGDRKHIVAETTHFTDFIAATVAAPEHPGLQSLNPTSLKSMKLADPTAGVQMIQPPQPNSQGTANLSYPIVVPPGRRGMAPDLAITYDNSRDNGWLGVGWDLGISSIQIDTRFGVPKYGPDERYLLDGEPIVPITGTGYGVRSYVRRQERSFETITRTEEPIGSGVYHWTVTDKNGTSYRYGYRRTGDDYGRLMPSGTPAKTARWMLETVEDIFGNQVLYSYAIDTVSMGDTFVQVYPRVISYTATSVQGGVAPAYSVTFNWDTNGRADAFSSGRTGFPVMTRQRLGSIDVKYGTTIVKKYVLNYVTGDFSKSLLIAIHEYGLNGTGTPIARHGFRYFEVPKNPITNAPLIFGAPTNWATVQSSSGDLYTEDSLRSTSASGHSTGVAVGLPLGALGEVANFTVSPGSESGSRWFEDLNGDGLPDLLPGNEDGVRQTLVATPSGPAGAMSGVYMPGWRSDYSYDKTWGMTDGYGFPVGPSIGHSYGTIADGHVVTQDINGDGLPDRITQQPGTNLSVEINGGDFGPFKPAATWTGYDRSGMGFTCGEILESDCMESTPFSQGATQRAGAANPLQDVITRWIAPHQGLVRISGALSQTDSSGGDGMVASIYHGGTLIWQRDIGPAQPSCAGPALNSDSSFACLTGSNSPLVVSVEAGQSIYTRVNGKLNADHDRLDWNFTAEYTQTPFAEQSAHEPWGPLRYKWSDHDDMRPMGQFYRPWTAPLRGVVEVKLEVEKDETSANLSVAVEQKRANGSVANWLSEIFHSATTAPNCNPTTLYANVPVEPGDELHTFIRSSLPYDPARVRVLTTVTYKEMSRVDADGVEHRAAPACQVRSDYGGETMCTAGTADPLQPVPISTIRGVTPTYHPLQRWLVERRSAVNASTTRDGRTKVNSWQNAALRLCAYATGAIPEITMAIQARHRLILSRTLGALSTNPEFPTCFSATDPSGGEVMFSIYANSTTPLAGLVHAYYQVNNSDPYYGVTGVSFFYKDPSYPTIDRWPGLGQAAPMSGGFHDLYSGLWNGNAEPFSPAQIVASGNSSYRPLYVAPQPLAPGDCGSWFSRGWELISSAAEPLWNGAWALAGYGAAGIRASVRIIEPFFRLVGYGVCELSGASYDVRGVRYSETHSCQVGVSLGGVVKHSISSSRTVSGLDLIDMNGDRYPDKVATNGIRYQRYQPNPNDPTTGTGTFEASAVAVPGSMLRFVRHRMYSTSLLAGSSADVQATNSSGGSAGIPVQLGGSHSVSQGFSRLQKDLRDVNGDGLPDVVESNGSGLWVQLNLGYGFGVRTAWYSPPWSNDDPRGPYLWSGIPDLVAELGSVVGGQEAGTANAIRLEDTGHQGPGVSASVGGSGPRIGQDLTYVRTLVDLVDINGDGLADQVMKAPGEPFKVKLNTGTGFANEFAVPVTSWTQTRYTVDPGSPLLPLGVAFATVSPPSFDDADALEFKRANAWSAGGNDSSPFLPGVSWSATGSTRRGDDVLGLMDIDGDGRLDHVLKNADPHFLPLEFENNAKLLVRRNETGKSNLLKGVDLPLGGTIELEYNREGNYVGTVAVGGGADRRVDMPDARWVLASTTVSDGRGGTLRDSFNYRMLGIYSGWVPSGYYDRLEREFLGFGRVTTTHADGSESRTYFHNQTYASRGKPYAQFEIGPDGKVLRGQLNYYGCSQVGCAANPAFATTPASPNVPGTNTPASTYVARLMEYDLSYEGNLTVGNIEGQDPLALADVGAVVAALKGSTFDSDGNLTDVTEYGDRDDASDDVAYHLEYWKGSENGASQVPARRFTAVSDITQRTTGGVTLRRRHATIDLNGNRPRLTAVTDYVYRGNQPVSGAPYAGQATNNYVIGYDDGVGNYGNVRTVTDPTGYSVTYDYDTVTRTHVTRAQDSFGLYSSSTINYNFGVPATTTDANGQLVTYAYDNYGRLSRVWGPTDPTSGTPTIQMTYSQASGIAAVFPWAKTQHKDATVTGDTIDTVTFVDTIGRVIQTKKESEVLDSNGTKQAGYSVSGMVVFDARGRVLAQHQPFFDRAYGATEFVPAPSNRPTTYTYDGLNRTLTATTPDNKVTGTTYDNVWPGDGSEGGLPGTGRAYARVSQSDQYGNTRYAFIDGVGRTAAIKEHNMIGGSRTALVTRYGYDVDGNVTQVIDARGNTTAAIYDSLQRMVSLSSKDTGATEYRYDLAGRLAEKQTSVMRAANQVIGYRYTNNRLTTVDYPNMTDVTYVYGTSAERGNANYNRAGRIKTVSMEGGTESRYYDAFGNVNRTDTTLYQLNAGGGLVNPVVTMKYSYDWLGRMLSLTFPLKPDSAFRVPAGDGEVLTYTYDRGGLLKGITGKASRWANPETYLTDVGYDEFGQRVKLTSGNGIANSYTYDPDRRWLTGITARQTISGGKLFQSLTYGYDWIGNITLVTDNADLQADNQPVGVGPSSTTYHYDNLNQLTEAHSYYRGHQTWGYRYSSTYWYDEIGNLTSKSQSDFQTAYDAGVPGLVNGRRDLSVMGPTTYTLGYNYDPARPRAPASQTETNAGGATATRTISYDTNGNKTGDTINSDSTILSWDVENRLKQVEAGPTGSPSVRARFLYDPSGERTQKAAATGGTTFYFNQFLVLHGNASMTKHIYAGESRIVSKTESAQITTPIVHFYHSDHIGSASYITDRNQAFVQHERYFPFGERWADAYREERSSSTTVFRNWLFTSKELDSETELYYFGARYLDPKASRWLSPDPILGAYMHGTPNDGVFNAANLGLYSYAWNNPVIVRDPTGLAPRSDPIRGNGTVERIDFEDHRISVRLINRGPRTTDLNGFHSMRASQYATNTSGVFKGMMLAGAVGAAALAAGPAVVAAAEMVAAGHPGLVAAGTAIAAQEGGVVMGGGGVAGRAALSKTPDFPNIGAAFRHYAKHVKGVVLGAKGKATLKPGGPDLPGFGSFAEYRAAARSFHSGPPGSGVLEGVRANGDLVRFDPSTGLFGVRSPGGTIRTFFRPDGTAAQRLQYFRDQFRGTE